MDTLFSIISAVGMLGCAWVLWQKANTPAQSALVTHHQKSVPHTAIPTHAPPSTDIAATNTNACGFDDDDEVGEEIPTETLASWSLNDNDVDDDNDPLPAVIRPTWGTTLYEALGVTRDATTDQIRSAYKEQARIWHPDLNSDPRATDEFAVVNQAYKVLISQRAQYDAGLNIEETLSL